MNETPDANHLPPADVKYLAAAAVLLLVIMMLLAGLWLRERNGRISAEAALTRQRIGLSEGIQQILMAQAAGGDRPLPRDDLPARVAQVDGQRRTLRQISAAGGQRLGLEPGDLLEVVQPATTGPVSKPSEPAGL